MRCCCLRPEPADPAQTTTTNHSVFTTSQIKTERHSKDMGVQGKGRLKTEQTRKYVPASSTRIWRSVAIASNCNGASLPNSHARFASSSVDTTEWRIMSPILTRQKTSSTAKSPITGGTSQARAISTLTMPVIWKRHTGILRRRLHTYSCSARKVSSAEIRFFDHFRICAAAYILKGCKVNSDQPSAAGVIIEHTHTPHTVRPYMQQLVSRQGAAPVSLEAAKFHSTFWRAVSSTAL